MNMVEADIRKTPGNAAFRLDGCYGAVEAYIRIGSAYGFQYEITRQKSYRWVESEVNGDVLFMERKK